MFCRWSSDDVFDKEVFEDLFNALPNSENKGYLVLFWVDHTFWKIKWKQSKEPYKYWDNCNFVLLRLRETIINNRFIS